MARKWSLLLSLLSGLLLLSVFLHVLAQAAPGERAFTPPSIPYLVKDINPRTDSAAPRSFANWNGRLYFSASGVLWRSDGTPAGTAPIFTLPLSGSISSIFTTSQKLFFTATASGLWAGDGTEEGSELLAELRESSVQAGLAISSTLFLITSPPCDPMGDCPWYLWKSDGTPAGTQEIASGAAGAPYALVDFKGKLYFLKATASLTMPMGLYVSDGSVNETVLVREITHTGTLLPNALISTNELMFFLIPTGFHEYALWKSDGTAEGTSQVIAQSVASPLGGLTSAGGMAYFFARDSKGYEGLWQSDGTTERTTKVAEVTPCYNLTSVGIAVVDHVLYFCAVDPQHGEELWRSDGTAEGTYQVKDIQPGISPSLPAAFAVFGDTLFFWADDGVHGRELWRSDGTEAGTVLVKDVYPGPASSTEVPSRLVAGAYLFFAADDGLHGSELWRSDGTEAGTVLVEDIGTTGESGIESVDSLFGFEGRLFFRAGDGSSLYSSLWASDGTAAGTEQFLPESTPTDPADFTPAGAGFYFTAARREIWYSNGTAAGTGLVKVFETIGLPHISQLTGMDGSLFFRADDKIHGSELWFTGNTTTTTVMIDINLGNLSSSPDYLTNISGTLFFQAQDGLHGAELWRSDGTISGTVMIKDIVPGLEGSYPRDLINGGGTLFFFLDNPGSPLQLWKSSGSEPDTVLIRGDIYNQEPFSDHTPAYSNGTLYFVVYDSLAGSSQAYLWKSDGTEAGTTVISTFPDTVLRDLTVFSQTLYFLAADTLWQSNGTISGTNKVFTHPAGLELGGLAAAGDKLFFSDGTRPWQSDGTLTGTLPLTNLSVVPGTFTGVGEIVFFVADDGRHGYELWAINPDRHFFALPFLLYRPNQAPAAMP